MSEKDATFKPFENNLDLKKSLNSLKTALHGSDDGELFLEKTGNTVRTKPIKGTSKIDSQSKKQIQHD